MNLQNQNDLAVEINKLHNFLESNLKFAVEKAFQIGELLTSVKLSLEHGKYLLWIKNNCNFSQKTAWNYVKCYEYKLVTLTNLQDVYKEIKLIEKNKKKKEEKRKEIIINKFLETGIKPDEWDRSFDYQLKKIKKRKENEKHTFSYDTTDELLDYAKNYSKLLKNVEKEKIQLKEKIGMSIKDESKFVDVLYDYVESLNSDNEKLMTLHNIIKFCKELVNKYQIKSVQNV